MLDFSLPFILALYYFIYPLFHLYRRSLIGSNTYSIQPQLPLLLPFLTRPVPSPSSSSKWLYLVTRCHFLFLFLFLFALFFTVSLNISNKIQDWIQVDDGDNANIPFLART
jgi:hypothetical protein